MKCDLLNVTLQGEHETSSLLGFLNILLYIIRRSLSVTGNNVGGIYKVIPPNERRDLLHLLSELILSFSLCLHQSDEDESIFLIKKQVMNA